MSARVLVVDDIPANVKLLEAKLSAEYYDVLTAASGPEALAICERGETDLVLLDVMMPGMNGFEVCRRLKSQPATAHIPVVMVTTLDQPRDRLQGLDAGADDFLTKPLDDTALLARVRSLTRLKTMTDELRNRAVASRRLGIADPLALASAETGLNGRILLVEDRPTVTERLKSALSAFHVVEEESDGQQALLRAADGDFDCVLLSLNLEGQDGLRLCSQLRSMERTRDLSVLLIGEAEERPRVLRGLEIGAHDFILRPVDRNELLARVRTQVRRKRFTVRLRDSLQSSMEMAVLDQLTGLHNRRFMDTRLASMFDESVMRARTLSLLVLDVDHFKSVNDSWGHDAGDEVLREFADRVRACTRGIDVVARMGGEEVVVVLPDTADMAAQAVAERIRERVENEPFAIQGGVRHIPVTVSIGVASRRAGDQSAADVMKRADDALYQAKAGGRNRVIVASAA
ncbi:MULTISPECIES: PleD family two-component system response regulator [unclassified Bosea (in: a-proteobacteria)]|uniref:PleD family two-component system response regulator n=1 Tax=unclassified Bosea (in: a-proteobacteria) TaxID=2653178 RepID=UPI0009573C87|nr:MULTISPECIES: PleD family two-component system response regulator [unclassified Bosea (in: a-proteobacteria)]TAJ27029.1 MAG: PleD family two-component system response regulator [Bosea sp. (in: a-proteobacteria)]SIP89924.1 two-component system, cell cycle response regulator [Bosea sp. TND4EK4]